MSIVAPIVLVLFAAVASLVAAAAGAVAFVFGGSVRNGALTVIDGNGIVNVNSRGDRHTLFRCLSGPGPRFCTVIEGIDWSPTGRRLLFSSTTISSASRYNGMHVLDLTTGKTRRAGIEGFAPNWSHDGRIALVEPTTFPLPVGSIFIRRIDGPTATEKRLTTGSEGYDSSPAWSPSGQRLVFATRQNGMSTISIIDSDGSHRRLLAKHASSPTWSPDGSVIAYRTPCGVKLITPTGTDVTPVVPGGCGSLGVRGVPHWSPDGRRIAIGTRKGIYVTDRDGRHRSFISTGGFLPMRSMLSPDAQLSWQPITK